MLSTVAMQSKEKGATKEILKYNVSSPTNVNQILDEIINEYSSIDENMYSIYKTEICV